MHTLSMVNTNTISICNTQNIGYDLANDFISYLDVREKTISTYTIALRQFFNYLTSEGINQPTRQTILNYRDMLKENGCKATTIQSYLNAVKCFFKWAEDSNIYPNIANNVKAPKISNDFKKDYLTSNQVKNLLSHIDRSTDKGKRDYAIILLMVVGGLRTIEIIRADVKDLTIKGNKQIIYVMGKGRDAKDDFIVIDDVVENAIRDYLATRNDVKPNDPLFTSTSNHNNNGRLTTKTIRLLAKEYMRISGYDSERLTAHSLRHTSITLALENGASLEDAQRHARHSKITTTMNYAHIDNKLSNVCSEKIVSALFD